MTEFRVIELTKFGFENLKQSKRKIRELRPDEILLRMKACSLNFRDILTIKGLYNPKQPLPLIPLSDGAGIVEDVGKEVKEIKQGDKVCPIFSQGWIGGSFSKNAVRTTLGGPFDGTLCEFMILKQNGVVKFPDYLSFEEASTLPCAGLTAWSAVFEHGRVAPGESVLILGTGGVSIFALQFAKALGAEVYAITSSQEKMEKLKELGAKEVVNYKENKEWGKIIKEISGGGVDHVIEIGGAGTLAQSLKALKPKGNIYLIGVLAGTSSQVDVIPILMNQIRVQGIFVGSKEMFERMNKALNSFKIKPVIHKVFDFSKAKEALEYLSEGKHFGKICIKIDGKFLD